VPVPPARAGRGRKQTPGGRAGRVEAARGAPTARGTLVAQAHAAIKARIFCNEYGPGFQATEPEIAERLGMSRTPVREALVQLQQEGLVEIVPRRGMRVVPLSPSDMRQMYDVLSLLEVAAVELLARRPPPPEAFDEFEAALSEMDAALQRDDLDGWAEADDRFHRLLFERCGNAMLATLAFAVFDKVHRARLVSLRLRPLPTRSNEEHRDTVAAIRRGDVEGARRLHLAHRDRTSRLLVSVLKRFRVSGL
jgi:DNA-binding GntR family transcriptional regulator